MFYRYPQKYDVLALDVSALQPIAARPHRRGLRPRRLRRRAPLPDDDRPHADVEPEGDGHRLGGDTATSRTRPSALPPLPLRPPPEPLPWPTEDATMNDDRPMNPYLAGFLLGLVLLLTIFVTGRGLGASGATKNVVVAAVDAVAPQHAAASPFYSKLLAAGTRGPAQGLARLRGPRRPPRGVRLGPHRRPAETRHGARAPRLGEGQAPLRGRRAARSSASAPSSRAAARAARR